jgi:Na+-translocating ferredoxin:NAD+ oxidoreductase subunit A
MELKLLFVTLIGVVLFNQHVIPRVLKIHSFLSIVTNIKSIAYTGLAATIILILASIFTLIINQNLLLHYDSAYVRAIFLIPFTAFLGYAVKITIKNISPAVYQSYDAILTYLIIISAELSLVITVLNIESGFIADISLFDTFIQVIAAGFTFTIVLLLIIGILERLEFAEVNPMLKGIPISILAACLLALAFYGFPEIRI